MTKTIILRKREVESLLVAHLRGQVLSDGICKKNWRITRMGSRGVEVSIVDKEYLDTKVNRSLKRNQDRYGI